MSAEDASSFLETLLARCTFGEGPLRLAVSGGADSTALALLGTATGAPCTLVHVDHGLRAEGDAEAQLVAGLAADLGATVELHRVVVDAGSNLEARARAARRAVLGDAATGHTADDRAETLLVNLLRGAGSAGLSSLAPGPVHPIVGLTRAETTALCAAFGRTVVADPMNDDDRFVRVRLRHEVLPLLGDVASRDVVALLNRSAALLGQDDAFLDALADVEVADPCDARALQAAPPVLARRAVRRWLTRDGYPPSHAEVERILEVASGARLACELTGGRRVARSGMRLTVTGP